MPPDVVLHKDVVIALLGASAALVGLILVFVGLVINAYSALGSSATEGAKAPYRCMAGLTLVPFGLGLAQIGFGTAWLLLQWEWLYGWVVGLFIATAVMLAVAAFWTVKELVWD